MPVKRRHSLPGTSAAAATAALVWNGDLPRPLQQILFQTADAITPELAAIGLSAAAVALTPQVRHRPISSLHTKGNP